MSTAEFASRGIGESPWSRNILGHMVGEFGATDALLRARRERPSRRAAECDQQFSPSDGDCHTPLPCEVRKGTLPRQERAVFTFEEGRMLVASTFVVGFALRSSVAMAKNTGKSSAAARAPRAATRPRRREA